MLLGRARDNNNNQVALTVGASGTLTLSTGTAVPAASLARGPGVLVYGRDANGNQVPLRVSATGALLLS